MVLSIVTITLFVKLLTHDCECNDTAALVTPTEIVNEPIKGNVKKTVIVEDKKQYPKTDEQKPDIEIIPLVTLSPENHRKQPREQWQLEAISYIHETIDGIVADGGGWTEEEKCEDDKCQFTFRAYSGGPPPDETTIAILNALRSANKKRGNGEKIALQIVDKSEDPWAFQIQVGRFDDTFPEVKHFLKSYIDMQEEITKLSRE